MSLFGEYEDEDIGELFTDKTAFVHWYQTEQDKIAETVEPFVRKLMSEYYNSFMKGNELTDIDNTFKDYLSAVYLKLYNEGSVLATKTFNGLKEEGSVRDLSDNIKEKYNEAFELARDATIAESVEATLETVKENCETARSFQGYKYTKSNGVQSLLTNLSISERQKEIKENLVEHGSFITQQESIKASNIAREFVANAMQEEPILKISDKNNEGSENDATVPPTGFKGGLNRLDYDQDATVSFQDDKYGFITFHDAWETEKDDKVRKAHQEMQGVLRASDGYFHFPTGEKCRFPADPSLPFKLFINCRCVVIQAMVDEKGRTIYV